MIKILVEYSPNNGLCVPDGKASEVVENIIKEFNLRTFNEGDEPMKVVVANELLVEYIRLAVMEGRINNKEIEFRYKNDAGTENMMLIDKFGNLDWWPDGFCDYMEKACAKLVGWDAPEN